jgi:hypothetical protein
VSRRGASSTFARIIIGWPLRHVDRFARVGARSLGLLAARLLAPWPSAGDEVRGAACLADTARSSGAAAGVLATGSLASRI